MNIMKAYEILIQRQMHEDHLALNRLTLGTLVNSILLLTFFVATETTFSEWMSIFLPVFGALFSLSVIFMLYASSKSMVRCYDALLKFEQMSEFDDVKKQGLRPYTDVSGISQKRTHLWRLGYYFAPLYPLLFVVLWFFLLFS